MGALEVQNETQWGISAFPDVIYMQRRGEKTDFLWISSASLLQH